MHDEAARLSPLVPRKITTKTIMRGDDEPYVAYERTHPQVESRQLSSTGAETSRNPRSEHDHNKRSMQVKIGLCSD